MGGTSPHRNTRDGVAAGMRVTYLLDSPNLGGAETTILQLIGGVPHITPMVIAAEPVSSRFLMRAVPRVSVETVPPVGTDWTRVPYLARTVANTDPDLVHVNLVDLTSNSVLLAVATASGVPTVATCHMTGRLPSDGPGRRQAGLARRVDLFIAVSHEIRGELLLLGARPDRVDVVQNGVAVDSFLVTRRSGKDPTGPARIGTVARLTAQKGIDRLIRAVEALTASGRSVELRVAGEGRDRSALEFAARGLPVTFLGYVDDVPSFLGELDVFCLPSRAEGLPLALLEAMAAGLPTLCTDVGDVGRAAGDAAMVVADGDQPALEAALDRLVSDQRLRRSLGDAARRRARRRFELADTLRTVEGLYRSVLSSRVPSAREPDRAPCLGPRR